MDLLTASWIPVRLLSGGAPQTISLEKLLCDEQQWTLSLPRDDMELAALQLLICLVQVLLPPENDNELRQRLNHPVAERDFQEWAKQWQDTFCLDHTTAPFMQVKGVVAKEMTSMDKLLAGVTGATNCAFINEPGQGNALCGGCTAIALFNQANNVPGFGGGFKSGLRGGTPVTTLVQGHDLRTTVWLNVLTQPRLNKLFDTDCKPEEHPVWQLAIQSGETISAGRIGIFRGLFWQPAHIELCPPIEGGVCCGCGQQSPRCYAGFYKAKFNFTVEGIWPHPHSPRLIQIKKGQREERFLAFTTSTPSWTQISRLIVDKQSEQNGEGQRVAAVVEQAKTLLSGRQLRLIVGGYRNNQASILERRHDVLTFNQGWQKFQTVINDVVDAGLSYKTALRKALYTFAEGVKNSDIKGAGVAVHEKAERQFYRQSDLLIPDLLASLDYENADSVIRQLKTTLHQLCETIFNDATKPYAHHPKLALSLAVARRSLYKHLSDLQPQGGNYHAA